MNDLLNAALAYHKQGIAVIPITPREKKPLLAWEEHQTRRATDEEIRTWWARWPDANVGIVTGAISGLVVIDLDSEEAKNKLKEMLNGYDVSAVPRSRTGKGWQLFFRHPGVAIPNRAGVLPGLDVRGDGGYVVAPPSIHPNGKVYRWEVPINGELPKLPPELFKLITSPTANGDNGYRERFNTAQALAGVPEGQRDDTLFRLACKLRSADVPQDMAEALILEAARNCQPPFPEREALEKVRNAYSRYQASKGTGERQEPLGAVAEVEEERELFDSGSVPFPEAAWSGLFGQWRDTVAPCTEAPLENLWGAFLVAAGLMLGRNAWKESPRRLYPNFYLLLLGQTGDSRKSTVLWLAEQLLRHVGEEVEILTGIVSTEGLFERLAKAEETRALGYVDELRSLLSVARRKGTQDLLPKLNSLYSCPDRETIDRREKPTTVIRPFFSLMAATAQEYVEDLLGNLEVAGGTLNRFLIVSGEEQPPKADVEPPSREAWERLAARLRTVRDQRKAISTRIVWSPEAKELWGEFYVQWKMVRKGWSAKAANLTARTHEHVQKIALVYSALSDEREISARSLATAIAVGEWLERTSLRLFGEVGLDRLSKAQNAILNSLKKAGSKMFVRDLQRSLSVKIPGKDFRDAVKVLGDNDLVMVYEQAQASGQKRKVVELVYSSDTRHLSPSRTSEKVSDVGKIPCQEGT